MDKRELIIAGIVVIIAVVVGSIIFAPHSDAKQTSLEVLNKNKIGENSTLYVKLKDSEQGSLANQKIHVKLTNSKNKVVYDKDVTTQATGVAIIKLSNVRAGKYNASISYDGDENHTPSSVSQKIIIQGNSTDDELENSTLIQETIADSQSSTDSSDSSSSQSSPQQSSSDTQTTSEPATPEQTDTQPEATDESDVQPSYDENGQETLPEYDEDGNPV